MKPTRQWLWTVSSLALIGLATTPARAAGTQAGEEITHSVSVSYQVGGIAQTDATASDTFYVDRKVNVTVAAVSTASTNVSAGQTSIVREFSVTNGSNAAVGFALSVAQNAEATFAISNVTIFVDADADGAYDAGEEITYIDSLAIDGTQNVLVAFDVPSTVANGTATDVILTAKAVEPGSAGATEIVASTGANTAGIGASDIQTVLADAAGVTDSQYQGDHSAKVTVAVDAADLTVTKSSTVISDPVNATTNPKAIPGAVVEYCIVVSNGASGSNASGVAVTDDFSSESGSIEFLPNAYSTDGDVMVDGDGSCTGGTATDKSYSATTTSIASPLSDVAAGGARSLRYRVTIK